jgi:enoyl-CoA hydratase/carnithine racemase
VSDILFERRGVAGVVTLNRPGALNAISHAMVHAFTAQLIAWESDPAVTRVVVTAAGGRAFCAGGDLRALYDLGRAGRYDEALQYWRDEYRLNAIIKRYRKPYVAIVDGIAFGGGVGLAVHGSHRVAGDGCRFAMPEVGIGFFPDVGATWFLPRLAGAAGTWCALTGEQIDADDATVLGLATQRVASSRLPDLLDGLCGAVPVAALLAAFGEVPGIGPMQVHHGTVGRLFSADRVEDILSALDAASLAAASDADFARRAAAAIRTKSPTSLKVALAQLRRGKSLDFEACLRSEFRIVSRVATGHDFYEGIRAVIVDKDNNPAWRPPTLDAVSDADIERYFAPVPAELDLS